MTRFFNKTQNQDDSISILLFEFLFYKINMKNELLRSSAPSRPISVGSSRQPSLPRLQSPGAYSNNTKLTSIEEKNSLTSLRPFFRSLLVYVSELLNHNGNTKSFVSLLQKNLASVEQTFNTFYGQLSKSGGISFSVSKNKKSGNVFPTIRTSAGTFLRNWAIFSSVLSEISENGISMIQNSIENNFSIILTALDSVQNGQGYNAGIHDPICKRAKKLQQSVWTIQGAISQLFSEKPLESVIEKITNDLKSLSRTINNAFSTEFSQFSTIFSENEKSRNASYNACCDVVFQVRAYALFESDMDKINHKIKDLTQSIDYIAETLELEHLLEPPVRPVTAPTILPVSQKPQQAKEEQDDEPFFSKSLPASVLLDRGFIVFKRSGGDIGMIKDFFSAMRLKVSEYEKQLETKQQEVNQMSQQVVICDTLRNQLYQESQKVNNLRATLYSQTENIKLLKDEIAALKDTADVNSLRDSLIEISNIIAPKLGESPVLKDSSDIVLSTTAKRLAKDVVSKPCLLCTPREDTISKVEKELGTTLIIEEIQILKRERTSNQKLSEKLRNDNIDLKQRLSDYEMSFNRIISTCDSILPSQARVDVFAITAVQQRLSSIQDTVLKLEQSIEKQRKSIAQEIEAELGVPIFGEIQDMLRKVSNGKKRDNETISNMEAFLKEIEDRLAKYLNIPQLDRPVFDAIRLMLHALENQQNTLSSVLEQNEQKDKKCENILIDIEKRLKALVSSPPSIKGNYTLEEICSKISLVTSEIERKMVLKQK